MLSVSVSASAGWLSFFASAASVAIVIAPRNSE
jgi:preprotein translocase subunit Sec61beta